MIVKASSKTYHGKNDPADFEVDYSHGLERLEIFHWFLGDRFKSIAKEIRPSTFKDQSTSPGGMLNLRMLYRSISTPESKLNILN